MQTARVQCGVRVYTYPLGFDTFSGLAQHLASDSFNIWFNPKFDLLGLATLKYRYKRLKLQHYV